jgi:hypothetical protein
MDDEKLIYLGWKACNMLSKKIKQTYTKGETWSSQTNGSQIDLKLFRKGVKKKIILKLASDWNNAQISNLLTN